MLQLRTSWGVSLALSSFLPIPPLLSESQPGGGRRGGGGGREGEEEEEEEEEVVEARDIAPTHTHGRTSTFILSISL